MKHLCFLMIFVLWLSVAGVHTALSGQEWENALKPKGKPAHALELAREGKTNYTIVISASPTTQDEKAAADLVKYLGEMTGAQFPIVREGENFKPAGREISVGRTDLLKNSGIPEAKLNLGAEGYAIAVKDDNLYLFGGSKRGAIYAVYSLLEEDLGCRWYDRKSLPIIPHISDLKLQCVPRHYVPVLDVRDPFYWEAFDADWAIANRVNFMFRSIIPNEWGSGNNYAGNLFAHSFFALVPPNDYFKTHPEYFSELNGRRQPVQLCLTNPEVLRIVADRVLQLLRDNPGCEYISVSQNDAASYYECVKCKAIDNAEGSHAATLLKFVNAVADKVAKEFPNAKIVTLAYQGTFMPPKTVKAHKNVVIELCTDSHAFDNPFSFVTETEKFQTAMRAWQKAGAVTHIWDYTINFLYDLLPFPNMPIIAPDLKFYIDHGAKGVFLEGSYQSPGGDNAAMRSWVWAQQLWNPNLPTLPLMRDFTYGYYGSAAEPIWKYNMLLWRMWKTNHTSKKFSTNMNYEPDTPFLSNDYISKSMELFSQAESLAKDPETMRRVKMAKVPLLYIMLCRGIGYYDDRSEFAFGSMWKSPSPESKAHYLRLADEFQGVVDREKITCVGEAVELAPTLLMWKYLMNNELPKVSMISIDNNWKFKPDPDDTGITHEWYSPNVNDSGWANVRSDIDQGWATQGYANLRGYAWYRQNIVVPADFDKCKHLYILFRGVDEDSEVYINGKKAFDHTCASTGMTPEQIWCSPFVFDARPFLQIEKKNLVAVRASRKVCMMGGVYEPAYVLSTDAEPDAQKLRLAVCMENFLNKRDLHDATTGQSLLAPKKTFVVSRKNRLFANTVKNAKAHRCVKASAKRRKCSTENKPDGSIGCH